MSSTEHNRQALLTQFEPLCFPGLEPFTAQDFESYLNSPSQFEFSLKKVRGQHILYGPAHAKARQAFFNELPQDQRCTLLVSKLDAQNLPNFELIDVQDIGVGHSVYALTLKTPYQGHTHWVLKREDLPNQSLFCKLLTTLGWPSYISTHFETPKIRCEFSHFLGTTTLLNHANNPQLEYQLARHAALGDILGRGDRHFNNYMLRDHDLLPIDISYLFWEGNEDWDRRYIAGGMYEFSMLARYDGETLREKTKHFFEVYAETLGFLKAQQPLLEDNILTFSGDHPLQARAKLTFIQNRLSNITTYFDAQKALYLAALQELQKRQVLKAKLFEKVAHSPEILDQHPLLKMYYLADQDQPSCFFLLEEHPQVEILLGTLGR